MKIMTKCIFLALLCMCMGVGFVVGNAEETDGNLNSVAEAPMKLLIGRQLYFYCNLTSIADDETQVEWKFDGNGEDAVLKNGDKYKIYENNSLVIESAEENDAGIYECRITGAQSYTKQFSVVYFSWKKLPKSLVVIEGNQVELNCEANGKPMPSVQWFKDAQQLNNTGKYTFTENEYGIPNAVLSFEDAQQEDRGTYECKITTDFGKYNASTFVRVKSALAPLYPLAGIVLEILLLIVVIIFFERRRAKQEYEESDTDQGPDMKNTSESRDSVRQRK